MFPLQCEWVLWEMNKGAKRQQWGASLRQVGRFDSVEGFWM